MKKRIIAILSIVAIFGAGTAAAEKGKKIQDNSFLIEEAYNQEAGVVQHIQTFQYNKTRTWAYAFTQEWPVPKQTHQLSYTIPVSRVQSDGNKTGIGDVMLNYRYQLVLKEAVAMAPRFSILLPTGNYKKGLGNGYTGFQLGIPLSVELSNYFVTHWNAGVTFTPHAKDPGGASANTFGYNAGFSFICVAIDNFNPMLEVVANTNESVQVDGSITRGNSLLINPGFRFAINFKSGLQIVPGVSAPIGVGPSRGSYSVLAYLSFEHPLF